MTDTTYNELELHSATFCKVLYLIVAVLAVVHSAVLLIYFWVGDSSKFDFVELVDLDYEGNIPTLYTAILFMICATLLMLVRKRAGQIQSKNSVAGSDSMQWLVLALIFCFLGIDEGVKLHEYLGDMMERFITAEGFLYFPWVIPYMTIFVLLVIAFLPFYLRQPAATRRDFFIAAVVYLCGAAVLDILGAREADLHGTSTVVYSLLYTVEEILEMIGLIIFIKALLHLLGDTRISISVKAKS